MEEDVGVLQLGAHLLRIGDEVGRQITAVELHALDNVEFSLRGLGFLDGDDALVADLVHRPGDHLAYGCVAIGGNRADLCDLARTS